MSLYPAMFSCKILDVAGDRKLRCHQTSKKKLCELLVFTFFEGFFFKHVKYEAKSLMYLGKRPNNMSTKGTRLESDF